MMSSPSARTQCVYGVSFSVANFFANSSETNVSLDKGKDPKFVNSLLVIKVVFVVAYRKSFRSWRRLLRARLHLLLKQHVHENEHGLRLQDEGAGRPGGACVEVLVHAVVVHDDGITCFPVVADAVVNLVAFAVEDVEGRLIHVPVLLIVSARRILLEMDVQRLCQAVDWLDVVPAEGLRAVSELQLAPADHTRHRSQPGKLLPEVVITFDATHEGARLLARVM